MKRKNILVTGCNGQLGSEIKELSARFAQYNFFFTSRDELDISQEYLIEFYVVKHSIDIIINAAAYTAVDRAESELEMADNINHKAVEYLSRVAKRNRIGLIHLSTDYVFNGENFKPYDETSGVNPINHYGRTKLDGERAMISVNPKNSIIIRTSWVYSCFGNNFLKTMLRLGKSSSDIKVISDQVGSPTHAYDLAYMILKIIPKLQFENVEIYHYSNEGICSWFDFAHSIFEFSDFSIKVNPISTEEYTALAKRPRCVIMDKTKIKKDFDITIPYCRHSLKDSINRLKL